MWPFYPLPPVCHSTYFVLHTSPTSDHDCSRSYTGTSLLDSIPPVLVFSFPQGPWLSSPMTFLTTHITCMTLWILLTVLHHNFSLGVTRSSVSVSLYVPNHLSITHYNGLRTLSFDHENEGKSPNGMRIFFFSLSLFLSVSVVVLTVNYWWPNSGSRTSITKQDTTLILDSNPRPGNRPYHSLRT